MGLKFIAWRAVTPSFAGPHSAARIEFKSLQLSFQRKSVKKSLLKNPCHAVEFPGAGKIRHKKNKVAATTSTSLEASPEKQKHHESNAAPKQQGDQV